MAAQSLGTLTLDIIAKTAQLASDLGKAARLSEQTFLKMQAQAVAAGTVIGNAISAGIEKIPELLTSSLDQFDQFSKDAQKVGIATDEFSKLAYAAKLSDVSTDDLVTTVAKLNKNIVAAAQGTEQQALAFSSLGIAVKNADGSLRAPQEVLGDLADLFKLLPDGATKTAIAIELLGKSGAQAIPLLNGGSEALKDLSTEAEQFGAVVSGENGKAAEDFNDNLTRLGVAAKGFANNLTIDLLPSLVAYSGQAVDAAKETQGFADQASVLAEAIKLVVAAISTVKTAIQDVTTVLAGAGDLIGRVGEGFNAAAKAAVESSGTPLQKAAAAYGAYFNSIITGAKQVAGNVRDQIGQNGSALSDSYDAIFNPPKPGGTKGVNDNGVGGDVADQVAQDYLTAQAKAAAAKKAQAAADAAAKKAQEDALALQKRITEATRTMADVVAEQTDQLYKTGIPAWDAYQDSLTKINKEAAKYTEEGIPTSQVAAFTKQMQDLAKATYDAATAQAQLDNHDVTLELQAQVTDLQSAANHTAQLAQVTLDYNEALKKLDLQQDAGQISSEDYQDQRRYQQQLYDLKVDSAKKAANDGGEYALQAARGIQSDIASFFEDPTKTGLKGFFDNFVTLLQKMVSEAAAAQIGKALFGDFDKTGQLGGSSGGLLASLLGGNGASSYNSMSNSAQVAADAAGSSSGSSSVWGSVFNAFASWLGGGRASGGSVTGGRTYLVGENGPELFKAPGAGTIVPNSRIGSIGGAQITNVYVQPTSTRRTADQIAQATARVQAIASTRNA